MFLQRFGEKRREHLGDAESLARAPDRLGKMGVVSKTRNDMPMQVRREIAQTRQIHLVRRQQRAQRRLRCRHDRHTVSAIGGGKVCELRNMLVPDHPAKSGERLVGQHHAAPRIAVNHKAAVAETKRAVGDGMLHKDNYIRNRYVGY